MFWTGFLRRRCTRVLAVLLVGVAAILSAERLGTLPTASLSAPRSVTAAPRGRLLGRGVQDQQLIGVRGTADQPRGVMTTVVDREQIGLLIQR